MQTSDASAGTRRRSSLRRLAWVLGLAIVVALAAAGFWLFNSMPLVEGSTTGADQSGLFLRIVDDPFGTGSVWVYCSAPGARFAWHVTLRNDGPFAVTLIGPGDNDVPVSEMVDSNAFTLVDLAAYHAGTPPNVAPEQQDPSDPATAPALSPTEIQPGRELELWARYQIGGGTAMEGGGASMRDLNVRFSVMSLSRSALVPLRDGVEVEGSTCPAA